MPKDVDQSLTLIDSSEGEPGALAYVSTDEPGIVRRRSGRGFVYWRPDRQRITEAEIIARIRALAIPPAWRDVWICPRSEGHIQAIGFDARGRKQYLYHAEFRHMREGAKFEHLVTFAEALPSLRKRVAADMRMHGLGRDKVLATVVHLLETTMIRVGNRAYERENHSYGLTTLQGEHVHVEGAALRFEFTGKSGKVWRLDVRDRRVANIVRACQHLPGQTLFSYLDDHGRRQAVSSCDVNAYLKQVSGRDITAKDFRTWTATVMATKALAEIGMAETPGRAAKAVRQVIKGVAERLGNTPAVCRASYIHPQVIEAYLAAMAPLQLPGFGAAQTEDAEGLRPEERAVLDFLRMAKREGALDDNVVSRQAGVSEGGETPGGDALKDRDKRERQADRIGGPDDGLGAPDEEEAPRVWATIDDENGAEGLAVFKGGARPGHPAPRPGGVRNRVAASRVSPDRSGSARKAAGMRRQNRDSGLRD